MSSVTPSLCSKKCPLVIDNTQIKEAAPTTYAMLFDGSGDSASFGTRLPDDLFDVSGGRQTDGADICFSTDSAGANQIALDPVYFDYTNKKCEFWVPVQFSSLTGTTTIYVWYKSKSGMLTQPAANASCGSQAVWTAVGSMVGVWHFGSGTLSLLNSVDGSTSTNNGGTATTGKIGGGLALASGGHYVETGIVPPTKGTFSIWGNSSNAFANNRIFGNADSNAGLTGIDIIWGFSGSTSIYSVARNGTNTGANDISAAVTGLSSGNHLVATTVGAVGGHVLYCDGVAKGSTALTAITSSLTCRIGRDGNGSDQYVGMADEFRISSAERSGSYVATDYAIQSSTSLVTVGIPVNVGTAPPAVLAACNYGGAA